MPVPLLPKPGNTDKERMARIEQEIHRMKDKPDSVSESASSSSIHSHLPWVAIIISCAALFVALLSLLKSV